MSQCSKTDGSCNLQLEEGVLKCTTHNSTDIVGKLYAIKTGEKFGTENKTYSADSGLREPAIVKNYDNDASYNTIGVTLSEMRENYKNMATSVAKYGGFYVGRYETSLSNATASSAGTAGTAQSKQGVIPTSAENSAISSWYGLYSKQKEYTGENGSVESSMIWGSQYDRILNWVKEGKNDEEKTKIISQKLGNHGGSITTTLVVASHFILSRTELCENQNQNNRRFKKISTNVDATNVAFFIAKKRLKINRKWWKRCNSIV